MVLAATAWHWRDPAVRLVKAADALRDGGYLAILNTLAMTYGDRLTNNPER